MEKKRTKEEDLEIVRRAILQSRSNPMNVQITNAEVKKKVEKDHDSELRDAYARQFEQGYLALTEGSEFKISPDKLQAMKKLLKDGTDGSIGEIADLSVDDQLLLYEKGITFHDQALHEKTINAFIFLTTINPNVQSFWIALALGFENNLNFAKAIDCLEAALHVEPADFDPFYSILRCSEALKDYTKLKALLEAAKTNPTHQEEASDLLEYLQANHS